LPYKKGNIILINTKKLKTLSILALSLLISSILYVLLFLILT